MRGPFPLVLDPAPAQVNCPAPPSQQQQLAPVVNNENTRFAGGGAAAVEQPVAANLETETPGPKPRSVARKRKPSHGKSQACRTGTDDIEATAARRLPALFSMRVYGGRYSSGIRDTAW